LLGGGGVQDQSDPRMTYHALYKDEVVPNRASYLVILAVPLSRAPLSSVARRDALSHKYQVPSSDPVDRLVTVVFFGLPAKARRGGGHC